MERKRAKPQPPPGRCQPVVGAAACFPRHSSPQNCDKCRRRRDSRGGGVHTNTIEGYFSIFKRGMKCVYQHCGEKHLHRYLKEFDFRSNRRKALGGEDDERRDVALAKIAGKRLSYRRINDATNA